MVTTFKKSDSLEVERILDLAPTYTRGTWSHYPCPFCNDSSAHLGVNSLTGGYHCFRCDVGGRVRRGEGVEIATGTGQVLRDGLPRPRGRLLRHGPIPPASATGKKMREYLHSRGIFDYPELGFAYGESKLVFPFFDPYGVEVFQQYKYPYRKGYMGPPGYHPRLDFTTFIDHDRPRILYFVEGPIDALRLRQDWGIWAAATCGITPDKTIIMDMSRNLELIKKVVVIFDAEHAAEVRARALAREMRTLTGVEAYAARWRKLDGSDPADAPAERIEEMLA